MKRNLYLFFALTIVLVVLGILIDIPKSPWKNERIKAVLGLDLQGGTELIYEADLSQSSNKINDLDNLKNVFRNRIDELGVAEPTIQTQGSNRIIIELPGIKNIDEAIARIGETYELVFMTAAPEGDLTGITLGDYYDPGFTYPNLWIKSDLSGRNLKSATATFNKSQGSLQSEPIVSITFDGAGKEKFAILTKNNLENRIAIVLDNKIVSAPTVQSEITDGKAIITGQKDISEAQKLAKRLNEGMLPVPAKLVAQQNVGATLGTDSLKKSMVAAMVGLVVLAVFMLVYYRFPGFLAVVALTIYGILALALFKLIPVTLSLAGIAGFVLSVGMAIDANVLIFERMKEELRAGKETLSAVKDGFSRAWPSIRDSNLSSIITAIILYYFGTGPVRGFALTLGIGVIVSMFSAVTITRTFMLLFAHTKKSKWLKI